MSVETTKEWQSSVTNDLRDNLVQKIVQAIFANPLNHPNAIFKSRKWIDYAKALEKKCYEAAETRSEYYHLVGAKIYRIQKYLKNHRLGIKGEERDASVSSNAEPSNSEQTTFMSAIQEQLEALIQFDSADDLSSSSSSLSSS